MPEVEMEPVGKSTRYEMTIDAPRDFVWNMRFAHNYALKPFRPGYKVKSYSLEYKEGGSMTTMFCNDEGECYQDHGKFIRIEPNEKLVWELSSGCIPGLKIRFEEYFEDHGDQTEYKANVTFENVELLSNVADLGCDQIIAESLEYFGNLVIGIAKTEKMVKE